MSAIRRYIISRASAIQIYKTQVRDQCFHFTPKVRVPARANLLNRSISGLNQNFRHLPYMS